MPPLFQSGFTGKARLVDITLPMNGDALVVEAYFDESGTHSGSPLMCVAGYVIEAGQCKRMQADWDETGEILQAVCSIGDGQCPLTGSCLPLFVHIAQPLNH